MPTIAITTTSIGNGTPWYYTECSEVLLIDAKQKISKNIEETHISYFFSFHFCFSRKPIWKIPFGSQFGINLLTNNNNNNAIINRKNIRNIGIKLTLLCRFDSSITSSTAYTTTNNNNNNNKTTTTTTIINKKSIFIK